MSAPNLRLLVALRMAFPFVAWTLTRATLYRAKPFPSGLRTTTPRSTVHTRRGLWYDPWQPTNEEPRERRQASRGRGPVNEE